jgi:hypothetical protein
MMLAERLHSRVSTIDEHRKGAFAMKQAKANQRNYQKELDRLLQRLEGKRPRLLLHSCCAPCSSYVLEYLAQSFDITLYFYNPNIAPESEYRYRVEELKRLVAEMLPDAGITVVEGKYEPERFAQAVRGLEQEPEGGKRCLACFRLRLEEAAKLAEKLHCDYFTTTLSISPLKNAQALNEIGEELAGIYATPYLVSDFKKREGYKRSIQLSQQYHLYRQDYCGCAYSKAERAQKAQQQGQQEQPQQEPCQPCEAL